MTDKGNFLASGPVSSGPSPAPAPQPAVPYRAPVSDGSSRAPMVGDRQKIAKPPAAAIPADASRARPSNDRTSGMAAAMGAMADKMHPTKRR